MHRGGKNHERKKARGKIKTANTNR
jgi:hypothetical protein